MPAVSSPERERALRRRHKHERQAVVFGGLVAALALAGLGSAAVYTDVLTLPLLDRDFTSPPPEEVAAVIPAPCPPEGTMPVAFTNVQVTVLNGSGRTGLAGQTGAGLTARGFAVLGTGNYPTTLESGALIQFGEAGIAAAYSLAAVVDAPELRLDLRPDATVDLVLGTTFRDLLDPAAVVLDPALPLVGTSSCVPLEDARITALPAPVPSSSPTAPTEQELQDGGEGFDDEAAPVEPAPEG